MFCRNHGWFTGNWTFEGHLQEDMPEAVETSSKDIGLPLPTAGRLVLNGQGTRGNARMLNKARVPFPFGFSDIMDTY
jgi:hypothetical protein